MDTINKLKILSESSQYDLACACGSNDQDRRRKSAEGKWIYPVSLPNGGKSIMLKTLMSNACVSDCSYCPLKNTGNARRCSLSPEEICNTFLSYYKSGKIFGLFLSSGIIGTPDNTMDKLITSVSLLRKKYAFRGYVHLKVIPGASDAAIEKAMSLSSAVSLNIETPGSKYFSKLSKYKNFDKDISRSLKYMAFLSENKYPKVKLTTQFVVGASDEPDSDILKCSFSLYNRLNYQRVYFSAYQDLTDQNLPFHLEEEKNEKSTRLTREHRLYQSDFLIRKYGFKEDDFLFDGKGNLSITEDPKEVWAKRHPEFYPVNINSAPKEALLRVPGIGPMTVSKIVSLRKIHKLSDISSLGIKEKPERKIRSYISY
ncbi:MAG TPA: radical SAM protein [Lentisphaeria bacterium]|nr:MAG: hypothetical protein A2X47_00135 [Lentisphaerae bacterium GWF2_38_69]HBM14897.1 radical SAM protein [Lentisphaeria bacterium]